MKRISLQNVLNGSEYFYNDVFTAAKRAVETGRTSKKGWKIKDDLGIVYPSEMWRDLASAFEEEDDEIVEKKKISPEEIFFEVKEISRGEFDKLNSNNGYRIYREWIPKKVNVIYAIIKSRGEIILLAKVGKRWGFPDNVFYDSVDGGYDNTISVRDVLWAYFNASWR